MNERWMIVGFGPAHLIKLSGSNTYTTACYKTFQRDRTNPVETVRTGMAGAPGTYFLKPVIENICEECLQKAKAQA